MSDKSMSDTNQQKGWVIVYTGDGKGKTTAALGMALRAAGHGNKTAIVQFIKSDWPYGEKESLKKLAPEVTMVTLGAGCIGIMDDDKPLDEHRRAAQEALQKACEIILSDQYDIVVLDEINIAPSLGLIEVDDIINLIKNRPDRTNLVLTGRNAPEKVIELADLVTEMREIKHPFRQGQLSRKGIDH